MQYIVFLTAREANLVASDWVVNGVGKKGVVFYLLHNDDDDDDDHDGFDKEDDGGDPNWCTVDIFCCDFAPVSHHFGYGLMDATAMVEAALDWSPIPDHHRCATEPVQSEMSVAILAREAASIFY